MVGLLSTPTEPHPDTSWRSELRGPVHLPVDAEYRNACAPWNRAITQRPIAVVEAADLDDIVTLVRLADRHGWKVTAQPSGHGAADDLADSVLVRTNRMDEIWIDADLGIARVGAGIRWGQLLRALDGTGRVALAGSNPDVSVVGYLLGGGLSWFGRRYGVASSTLRAVEIVDASGRARWVTDNQEPDLMWALRGGGGNYGIVTRVEIDLPHEPTLNGGKLTYPISHASSVLEAFAAVTCGAEDGLTCWATLMHVPDLPDIPTPARGQSFVTIDLTQLGGMSQLDAVLAQLRQAGPVLGDTVGPISIGDLHTVAAEPTEPAPALDWSTTLSVLDAATMDTVVAEAADRTRTPLTAVQIRHLGAALATADPNRPGAFDHLDGHYLLHAFGVPAVPDLEVAVACALRDLIAATRPHAAGRTAPTFLGTGMTLADAFDAATLDRLRDVKTRSDPHERFRGNRPL